MDNYDWTDANRVLRELKDVIPDMSRGGLTMLGGILKDLWIRTQFYLPHPRASDSRPEGTRRDERTGDGRSEGDL